MPIPDYQTLMLPLLRLAADGQEHAMRDAIERLAADFHLTDQERRELLPSGQQPTFDNRAHWARTYLRQAGLLDSPRRGYFAVTPRGQEVLAKSPTRIDVAFLSQFPEFLEFRTRRPAAEKPAPRVRHEAEGSRTEVETPEEAVEGAYRDLREALAKELIQQVRAATPAFFERLVVELLVRMGYGGSRKDAGQAIGRSGDGGIDGIINEDRLGLDIVYVQAKRWDAAVGRPEIQKFAGALQGQRARKGIFITTSSFSRDAEDFVRTIDSKIILIDGEALTEFMIDYNVGVTPFASYELKKLDAEYFAE
jgi:restriction system protein